MWYVPLGVAITYLAYAVVVYTFINMIEKEKKDANRK